MALNGLFSLQFLMFAEIAVGYVLCRTGILKPSERSVLSRLIMNVLLPCSIISSFKMEMSAELAKQFSQIFIISFLIEIMGILMNLFIWKRDPEDQRPSLQYGTICSNAGFMGNAVSEGVYGAMGLILTQVFLVPSRIIAFSFGTTYFSGAKSPKEVIHIIFTNPCIIAVLLGLSKMLLGIDLPAPVSDLLTSLGRCASPLAMILIGMILGQCGFGHLLSRSNLKFAFVRLLLIPVMVLIPCVLLGIDSLVTSVAVILAAMPAGTTITVFADRYHANAEFSANVVVLSTLISIAILPLWVYVLAAFA